MSNDFLNDLKGKASDAFDSAEKVATSAKKSFARALVDATNLQPADMRQLPAMKESQSALKSYAEEASDLVLPGVADAIPIGKLLKGGKAAARIMEKLKDLNKTVSRLDEVMPANLPEMTRRGYELLKDVEPKSQKIGKVIVKDSAPVKLGKVILKD